jgi:hypothetical protein
MRSIIPGLLALAAVCPSAPAQVRETPPTVEAHRLDPDARLRLDGVLDEAAWQHAAPATGFRQQEPREGAPATERTEVRVLFDDDNLYIGVIAYDTEPDRILGSQMQRDAGLGADDRFMWVIDTFLDGRTGYFFEINPLGLMGDGLLRGTAGGGVNKSWDGIWEARVARGDYGWSAEIRIPFRTLNFNPDNSVWGINFQRTVRRRNEETLWTGWGRNQALSQVANAGRLTGLHGISQGIGLEARPYVVATSAHAPGRLPAQTASDADMGLDINYSVTPGLRASLTLNTDFAEAEVDQRRVNLTRFPLVFPERRDFFLEGSGVHAFSQSSGPTPYFSRRIGLVEGNPVPIRAGARINGQAGAYELAALQVRTGATAFVPAEDFTVLRVKRGVLRQSTIGAVYTRRHTANDGALLPTDDISSPAAAMPEGHTLGVDADFSTARFRGNRNLQLEAFLVWHSDPFGNTQTTFDDRSARGFRLSYPNDRWRAHVSAREFGNAYNPPVGFVTRRGFRRVQPTIGFAPRPERWESVRQLDFSWFVEYLTDLDGRVLAYNHTWNLLGIRFASGDQLDFEVGRGFERLDAPFRIYRAPDGNASGDVHVAAGDYTTLDWEASARAASRRRLSGNVRVSGGEFWSGTRTQIGAGLDFQARPGLAVGISAERNDVSLDDGAFTTSLVRMSGGWHMSPWMSLTGNAQYDDVSRTLGTFARFRWIVRPGSDIFLVYTHNLLEDPTSLDRFRFRGMQTLERKAATKVAYTHRF